jgi:uncharacterized damage-inducible protein DinB
MSDLSYPIGKFEWAGPSTPEERERLIAQIAAAPAIFRAAVAGLSEKQLDTPYRPGGWTVRQVVHHVPDSHLNAYIRCKLALTEHQPTIKPYDQERWALLADSKHTPIETSLVLLEALHERWVALLRALESEDFGRVLIHPEHDAPMSLDKVLAHYAWHGKHHAAHITSLRERMGWKTAKPRAKAKSTRVKAKPPRKARRVKRR